MIDPLRKIILDWLDPARGELRKRVGRLDSRVSLIAQDLDCEIEGSIAEDVGVLHARLNEVTARLDEWIPTAAENAAENEGLRAKGKRR